MQGTGQFSSEAGTRPISRENPFKLGSVARDNNKKIIPINRSYSDNALQRIGLESLNPAPNSSLLRDRAPSTLSILNPLATRSFVELDALANAEISSGSNSRNSSSPSKSLISRSWESFKKGIPSFSSFPSFSPFTESPTQKKEEYELAMDNIEDLEQVNEETIENPSQTLNTVEKAITSLQGINYSDPEYAKQLKKLTESIRILKFFILEMSYITNEPIKESARESFIKYNEIKNGYLTWIEGQHFEKCNQLFSQIEIDLQTLSGSPDLPLQSSIDRLKKHIQSLLRRIEKITFSQYESSIRTIVSQLIEFEIQLNTFEYNKILIDINNVSETTCKDIANDISTLKKSLNILAQNARSFLYEEDPNSDTISRKIAQLKFQVNQSEEQNKFFIKSISLPTSTG